MHKTMDYQRILEGILDIGEAMLCSGAENFRLDDTMYRMCKSYGFKRYDVFVIPSNIQITVETPEGEILTQIRHIESTGINYDRLDYMNNLARYVCAHTPDARELHIDPQILSLAEMKKGLVLITGAAGSGKSTTLACMIDQINRQRSGHIITIEDPIEYLHRHCRSIVSQREIGQDTPDYIHALVSALREAPDVILVGEMRDLETTQTVLSAAETGHLVFSSLHTTGAANTINRIIDIFPSDKQQQIRVQLSMVLRAIVSQQLVPCEQGGLIPAFEIMMVNNAIQTQIRENKIHQIDNTIQSGQREGMVTMDASLLRLLQQGRISRRTALLACTDPELMRKRLSALFD